LSATETEHVSNIVTYALCTTSYHAACLLG